MSNGDILPSDVQVQCSGTEERLIDCPTSPISVCNDNAGVSCLGNNIYCATLLKIESLRQSENL